jgi:hypothetical protein
MVLYFFVNLTIVVHDYIFWEINVGFLNIYTTNDDFYMDFQHITANKRILKEPLHLNWSKML